MEEEKRQFQIEDYLEGKLTGVALANFEAQLKTDPSLVKEVELFQQMDDLLGESDVIEFDSMLKVIMQEDQKVASGDQKVTESAAKIVSIGKNKTPFRRYLAIAASVLLIVATGSVIYFNTQVGPNTTDLYATHMTFPNSLTSGSEVRGDNSSTPTDLQRIQDIWKAVNNAYQAGEHEIALKQLDALVNADPNFVSTNREEYYFKKGLVLLKLKQPKAAIGAFDEVKQGEYLPNAQWKKALTYLLIDTDKAKELLLVIADSSSPDAPTAKLILEELAD